MTQKQLAATVNVSGLTQPRISAMEKGEHEPTLAQLDAMEKAMGCERGYLLRLARRVGDPIDVEGITVALGEAVRAIERAAQAAGVPLPRPGDAGPAA